MYFELLKFYLNRSRITIIGSITYMILMQIMNNTDGSLYKYSITASCWVAYMYVISTSKTHSMLSSLPVSRNKIILADYTIFIFNVIVVNIITVSLILAQRYFNHETIIFEHIEILPSLLFITIVCTILGKSFYDYFWRRGLMGKISSIAIAIISLIGLTIFTIAKEKKALVISELWINLSGIILLLIIFYVTKKYFRRLDF